MLLGLHLTRLPLSTILESISRREVIVPSMLPEQWNFMKCARTCRGQRTSTLHSQVRGRTTETTDRAAGTGEARGTAARTGRSMTAQAIMSQKGRERDNPATVPDDLGPNGPVPKPAAAGPIGGRKTIGPIGTPRRGKLRALPLSVKYSEGRRGRGKLRALPLSVKYRDESICMPLSQFACHCVAKPHLLLCQLHDGSGFYLRCLASEETSAYIVFIIEFAERYTANLRCSEIHSNMKFKYQSGAGGV